MAFWEARERKKTMLTHSMNGLADATGSVMVHGWERQLGVSVLHGMDMSRRVDRRYRRRLGSLYLFLLLFAFGTTDPENDFPCFRGVVDRRESQRTCHRHDARCY